MDQRAVVIPGATGPMRILDARTATADCQGCSDRATLGDETSRPGVIDARGHSGGSHGQLVVVGGTSGRGGGVFLAGDEKTEPFPFFGYEPYVPTPGLPEVANPSGRPQVLSLPDSSWRSVIDLPYTCDCYSYEEGPIDNPGPVEDWVLINMHQKKSDLNFGVIGVVYFGIRLCRERLRTILTQTRTRTECEGYDCVPPLITWSDWRTISRRPESPPSTIGPQDAPRPRNCRYYDHESFMGAPIVSDYGEKLSQFADIRDVIAWADERADEEFPAIPRDNRAYYVSAAEGAVSRQLGAALNAFLRGGTRPQGHGPPPVVREQRPR
jgi:hypothetical protein